MEPSFGPPCDVISINIPGRDKWEWQTRVEVNFALEIVVVVNKCNINREEEGLFGGGMLLFSGTCHRFYSHIPSRIQIVDIKHHHLGSSQGRTKFLNCHHVQRVRVFVGRFSRSQVENIDVKGWFCFLCPIFFFSPRETRDRQMKSAVFLFISLAIL
jgi:hypothetical protein